jgi:hypothetical protein
LNQIWLESREKTLISSLSPERTSVVLSLNTIKKVVALVGLPASGKTQTGMALARLGHCYLPEIAKQLISKGFIAGEHADSTFDKAIMDAEFARDRKLFDSDPTTFLIETWHLGNLAYADARESPVFPEYKAEFRRIMKSFDINCLILDIDPALSWKRCSRLACNQKSGPINLSLGFLDRVHQSIARIMRNLNLKANFIDASKSLGEVRHDVLVLIKEIES